LIFAVSLVFSGSSRFELQVHEIMEFGDLENDIHDVWSMLRPCAEAVVKI
jgi:hypothetical protein